MRGESVILLLILFYAAREGNNLVEHDVLIFPSRVTRYIYYYIQIYRLRSPINQKETVTECYMREELILT